jgi:hypothetical protein
VELRLGRTGCRIVEVFLKEHSDVDKSGACKSLISEESLDALLKIQEVRRREECPLSRTFW